MESGVLKQVIDFQYDFSDEGFYVHHLYYSNPVLFYITLSDEGHTCADYYEYTAFYLNLYPLSFVIFPFIFTTYSK